MNAQEFLQAMQAEVNRLQEQVNAASSDRRREKTAKQLAETVEVLEWIGQWEEDCWDMNDEAQWKRAVMSGSLSWKVVVFWLMSRQGWKPVDGKLTPPKD
jgi:hypothetical protein